MSASHVVVDADKILDDQVILLKRGRTNAFGWEPAWNSYFDFYASSKYISPPLLKLEDISLHLFLRKNLNDQNPKWKMPTIRQLKKKFAVSQDKIDGMMKRLEDAHLLRKVSGAGQGFMVGNHYILSDPIQTLDEFLIVACEGVFPRLPRPEWCTDERYTVYRPPVHYRVPAIGTDQQTLKKRTEEEILWNSVLKALESSVPSATYNIFLADTSLLSVADGVAIVLIEKPHTLDWLQRQMAGKIRKTLAVELSMAGKPAISNVEFQIATP